MFSYFTFNKHSNILKVQIEQYPVPIEVTEIGICLLLIFLKLKLTDSDNLMSS